MTPTTPAAAPLSPMLSVRPFPNDERPYRGALIIRMSGVRAPSRLKLVRHAPTTESPPRPCLLRCADWSPVGTGELRVERATTLPLMEVYYEP